ncbi:MAG: sensor histidine kinase [Candidatus Thiodiazotropha lotti]|nr:sensor histidine kinase [Candidatus Thiodiazotropha lotti]
MYDHIGSCKLDSELVEIFNILDPVLLIDKRTQQVRWISIKFKDIENRIEIGDNLESVSNLLSSDSINQRKLYSSLLHNDSRINHIFKTSSQEYDIEIYHISKLKLVVRLKSLEVRMLANSRHLEDREKLLFTSRSITVSEMASTLAHELNQPIGALSNLIFGIKSRLENGVYNNDVSVALDKSLEQIKFTADIISRIRDFTHSRKPTLSTIKITTLVNKCVSLMDWEIKNAHIEFSYLDDTENISVFGDEVMLQQVIVNLIRNGIDAGEERPNIKTKVNITTSLKGNYIEILIKDNGKGISKNEADNVFIPFASNKTTGMGIGLNICRSFIELHKGKLWLSRNSDAGCTSHIMLPMMS